MKTYINWSGGKDSSLCLYKAKGQGFYPEALLTSVNKIHNRISMHGVRTELLQQQAVSIGLPLHTIELPEQPGMQEYETLMQQKVAELKDIGFTHALFGDIYLEDLKRYREEQLHQQNIECLFPLWKTDTRQLMQEFLAAGFKAIVVCINEKFLNKDFCGRLIDESFVQDLPAGVDVCGENGEYHSFVYDGPVFRQPIAFEKGSIVYRRYDAPKLRNDADGLTSTDAAYGFYFCDLIASHKLQPDM